MAEILKSYKSIVLIFFILLLGAGVFFVKDYGISCDEPVQREIGFLSFDYAAKGDQSLLRFGDRAYGPFFEVVLVALEKGLHLTNNMRAVYLMRHTVTFLFFYLGVIFFYKLCSRIFQSWRTGLLGCLFLILSPRIFADAFYNSKDIPCLSVFIIGTYTLINYLENKTALNAFIHALASSVLIDIRIAGIIIPVLTLLFADIDICLMKITDINFKRCFLSFFMYCLFLIVLTILFWPFLWSSPLNNFNYAVSLMSHFQYDNPVLYLGRNYEPMHLPWHYIPLWIAISTPLVYVGTFCVGFMKTIILAGRGPVRFYTNNKREFVVLLLIALPILAVICNKSVVYNGWRHLFFVYPAFLIFSIIGLRALFSFTGRIRGSFFIQMVFFSFILFDLGGVASFMIRNHPYQNVFFNSLAGRSMKEVKQKFELDYWGVSFTKALEYIVTHDSGSLIKIYVPYHTQGFDGMLSEKDRKRLEFVDHINQAKYFLGDYLWHNKEYPYMNECYAVRVDGEAIAVVYKL